MRKPILLTILACCLLFFGFESASAATTYTNFTTPGANGLVASPLTASATQTNLIVYGLAIKNTTATAAYTSMRFDLNDGDNWSTDFSGNITLYVMTAAQYAGAGNNFSTAAATAMQTIASPATANLTFSTLTGSPAFAANATYYYFITVNYTTAPTPAQTTTAIELNQTKGPANVNITETGANYTLNPGINFTASSTAGFATSPLSASFTAQPIFGVTMTNSSATSFTFGQFDFSTNGGFAPNAYFANFKLYVNTTGNTFAGAALVTSTFTGTNSQFDMNVAFTSTIPANTAYSYFIVADYTYPSPTTARTFQLSLDDAEPASGNPDYTQGLSLLSTNYAIPVPPAVTATATSLTTTVNTSGLANSPIAAAANYAVYGMSLVPSSTGTTKALTGLSFTTTTGNFNNYYYGTAYLYASSNSSFDGTAIQISTVTTGGNNTLNFTGFTTAQNIVAGTTKYYYVVIVYAAPGVAATASQALTLTGTTSTATVTIAPGAAAGPSYTYNPIPYVTATVASLTNLVNTSGLANSPIGTAGNYAIYGMSLTPSATGSTTTLTGLTFTSTSAQNNNYFYATAYLYASANPSYDGTAVKISTVTTGASKTLAFTGFTTTQTLTAGGAPIYYYIVIVYAAPGAAASNTSTLDYTSATSAATITATSTTGPTYTFNPTPAVTATDVAATSLTNSTIYIGQTNIAVAGIGLTMNIGATTLSQLTFSFTPTATATAAQYFTNVRVVSSTSAPTSPFNYSSTTPVVGASIAITTGVITATIPAAVVSTATTYYYLVVDYTVTPEAAARTFTFNPTSYTTALTGKVTTAYTANTFNCTQPTYYWTGAAGDNNWTTANNWEVTTTAPILVNGYYPGQLITTDNAVVSPVQTTPTINLTANETIASLTNSAGVTTALNISSGITLTEGYFTVGATSGTSASTLNLAGGGTLSGTSTTTASTINYAGTVNVMTNGNLKLGVNSGIYILGATSAPAKLVLSGGTINASSAAFYLNGTSASLQATSGTLTAINGSELGLAQANAYVLNNGATITFTDPVEVYTSVSSNTITNSSGTFTVTDANTTTNNGFYIDPGALVVSGGTFNVASNTNGTTDLELGEDDFFGLGLFGNSGTISVTGGILNVTGGSLVHLAFPGSTVTNNGGTINTTTGSQLFADEEQIKNITGTLNVDASTVNLAVGGTSLTNNATANFTDNSIIEFTYLQSSLTNTSTFNTTNTTLNFNANTCQVSNTAGKFNFGLGSVMNMASTKSTVVNSGSGTFTCAPTSIFNLSYVTGTAANAPTVTNTSTNPFTLLSSTNGSATIGKIASIGTNGSFIGQFNVQRYISTASRNYRLLASQVNQTKALTGTAASPNQVDISQLGKSVTSPQTFNGAFIGGPGAGFTNYVANPIMYLYQESILPGTTENSTFTSGKNVGITGISVGSPYLETTLSTAAGGTTPSDNSSTVKIPPGNAYLLYYIHDNQSTSVTSPLDTSTTTATGYINQGSVPFVLWGSGTLTTAMTLTTGTGALYPGVTMVGNPYPSTIDLKQVYADNVAATAIFTSGTGEAFYELDPSTEQFASYNYNGSAVTTSGSDASEYIASGQGFYVTVVKSGKTLTFNEDQKTTSTTTPVFPATTLESINPGPGTTVDNVSHGNFKTNNAVLSPTGSSSNNALRGVTAKNALALNTQKTPGGSIALASTPPSGIISKVIVKHTPNNSKVYSNTPPDTTIVTPPPPPPALAGLHLKLVMDSLTYDECGLYFKTGWSDKSDNNDAKDLDGTGGKVFLSSYTTDDVRTSINAMSNYTGGKRVKLFVKFSAAGIYKLQMSDIQDFDTNDYSVFLLDNMLKDSLDLTLYKSYNFNYGPGTANDSTRFVLAIEHKPVPHYALLSFAGQKVTQGVQLNWTVKNESNTTQFVVQKLGANNTYAFLDSLQSDSAGDYSMTDQHPTLGNNTYRLQQTDALGNITYSAPVTIGYNSTSPNGGLTVYPNPAKSTVTITLSTSSLATQVSTMDVYNTSGTLVEHKSVNSNSFTHDVSSYQLGVYIIELKSSNGQLVGKTKLVKVQ